MRAAAKETALLGQGTVGLTLGYSILVRRSHGSIRLLSHEFRQSANMTSTGRIAAFLPIYLEQIVEVGYSSAPFEVDARAH